MSEADDIKYLDEKIELFLDYLAMRKGPDRNRASLSEIAARFKTKPADVERVMHAAHQRNRVHVYASGNDPLYIINTTL